MQRWTVFLLLATVVAATAAPPPEAVRHYEAGMAAKKAGEPSLAATELSEAVRLAPDYTEAHYALAWVYAGLRWVPGAAREFETVSKLAVDTPQAREARAAVDRLVPTALSLSHVQPVGKNATLTTDGRWCYHSLKGAPSRVDVATGRSVSLALPSDDFGFLARGQVDPRLWPAWRRGVA